MRILHITNTLQEGGVETLLQTLLPGIKQAGHEVEVLVLTKGKDLLAEPMEKEGIRVHKGKYRWVYNPLNVFVIRKYAGHYDVIHAHLFPTQYFAAVAKLFCPRKIKFITTEHSVYNKRRSLKWLRLAECWVYKQFDLISTVSGNSKFALDRWACTEKKTSVIYNGIALDSFYKAKPCDKGEFGLKADDKVVMMIARFYFPKDHATPVKALQYLPGYVHLMYAGSGDTVEKYKKLAQDLHVGDRVHFLGKRSDIPKLAGMCDVGVLSSAFEGFGLSALEIMAAGKPVVVSDIDGMRELVEGAGVLFRNYDEHDLAVQIEKLILDQRYYDEVAQRCLLRSECFSSEKMVRAYLSLYQACFRR